jgi:excisionase family DNA binding protein
MRQADREKVRVYSIKTAAHKLSVSKRTIYHWIKRDLIRVIKLTERRRGIPVDEIERIASEGILR